jgi:hypothetical protein
MKGKIMIALLMALCMIGSVCAISEVSHTPPLFSKGDSATTTVGLTADEDIMGGLVSITDPVNPYTSFMTDGSGTTTISVDVDFLTLSEGLHTITYQVQSGVDPTKWIIPAPVHTVTIDRTLPIINDFGFDNNGQVVTYLADCNEANLDVALTTGQYQNPITLVWTNFVSGVKVPFEGIINFRGHCADLAGNSDDGAPTPLTLFIPPEIVKITKVAPIPVEVDTSGLSWDINIAGSGAPVAATLNFEFSKPVTVTGSISDGGSFSSGGASPYLGLKFAALVGDPKDYVLTLTIDDGVNPAFDEIVNLHVTAADGILGDTTINVLGSTEVPTMSISGVPQVIKGSVLPGDYALIRYPLSMSGGDSARVIFDGYNQLDTASNQVFGGIIAFCGENYDAPSQDLIAMTPGLVYNPVTTIFDETNPLNILNCADTDLVTPGFQYDVYLKLPVNVDILPGAYLGTVSFGLYP